MSVGRAMGGPGRLDYPLAEKHREGVRGPRGRSLDAVTLESLVAGETGIEDLRITPEALMAQASIARDAGRAALADNFERAAEMTRLPQAAVMEIYELLRPGRARDKAPLLAWADRLRVEYHAPRMAAFLEEAAEVYERRGLFRFRY